MKKIIFVFVTILFVQFANAQDRIVVTCKSVVCKGVDDGRWGSRDGEEIFGFLRCGVSTSARPITLSSNGVPPINDSPVVFLKNSTQSVQLTKGEKFEINQSRKFKLKLGEANSAAIILNGDLDELDGRGFPDDVDNFISRVPLAQISPATILVRAFHRDDNDKLERFKADERIQIPFNSLPAKGQSREYTQRFGSGGTYIIIYWNIMRV